MSPAAPHPAEARLLLAACHVGPSRTVDLPDGVDWDRLGRLAGRHGVVPLVAAYARSLPAGAVPDREMTGLRTNAQAVARRSLALTAELTRIVRSLSSAGLTALPYKGPLLAASAYESLALRTFADLDLLLPGREIAQATEILCASGYEVFPKLSPARRRTFYRSECECWLGNPNSGVTVELHWAVRERLYRFPMDVDRLAARAQLVPVAGQKLPTVALEDLLPILAIHGLKHGWDRLKWVRDIAGLLERQPQIDWDHVLRESVRLHAERVLALPLLLARDLLAAPLPVEIARRLERDRDGVALAAELGNRLMTREPQVEEHEVDVGLYFRARPRLSERAAFVFGSVMTPTLADWEAFDLPDSLFPLYYLYRPLRLLRKHAGRRRRRPVTG